MPSEKIQSVLETVEIASKKRTTLFVFDCLIEAPNWTRDGKHLIYNSGGSIYSFDLGTKESRKIVTSGAEGCNNDHVLSPDGSYIAVSSSSSDDGLSKIYIAPIKGGNARLVTPDGPSWLHGWSPDGKTLAYCARRGGQYDIYTIPAQGGEETRLTDTAGLDDGPEYSPCGKYIWFNSTRSGPMQLWRMNADGAQPRQMTFDSDNNWFPHISPDGKLTAFLTYNKDDVKPDEHPANKNVEIRLVPAQGGEPETIGELFGGQGTINVNSWSPQSDKLAFVSYRVTR